MVRIAGVNLPNKRLEVALTYIYGIGRTRSNEVLAELGINRDIRPKDLTETDINRLKERLEKGFTLEGDLRREVVSNIKRLKEIFSYRGLRHMRNLPVRGQRTKTNSRTVRGNTRKTMGSGRKDSGQKT